MVKGARITVSCDCGKVNYLDYGATWQCEDCHRRWNTAQIPADEYWGLMREMRDGRIRVIGVALATGAALLVLGVVLSQGFLLLLPITFGGWYLVYMPRWRRRLRLKARAAPTWTLRPE